MKANTLKAPDLSWTQQKRKLRRDGSMLRFKLGGPAPRLLSSARADSAASSKPSVIAEHVVPFQNFEEAPPLHFDEEDDQDARLWICNRKTPTLAKTCLGGLRGDPFDTFPIPNKGHVSGAFDYYAQVWFDLSPQLPHHRTPEGRSQLSRQMFTTLLTDEMFFEQCVAFSMFLQGLSRSTGFTDRLSEIVTRHTNNVIIHLRARMATDHGTSDVCILTMIGLAGVCMIANDFNNFAIHCNAIKNVVALRGGYDNLGFDGYLKANALTIVGIQDARNQVGKQQNPHRKGIKIAAERLKHPFPPDLCSKIGKLPPGFRELSLTTEISLQHIDALEAFARWILRNDGSPAEVMTILTALPDSTPTAILLSQALSGYTFYLLEHGQLEPSQEQLGRLILQTSIGRLKSVVSFDKRAKDFVLWAYLVLQNTTEKIEPESWRWASQRVSSIFTDLDMLQKLEKMFLPIPGV